MNRDTTRFLALAILCAVPGISSAASLNLIAPASVPAGGEFTLTVTASSTDRGFNAAEAKIFFPSDTVEVVSISTAASATIFNFWLELPSFSNERGTILFSGGTSLGVEGPDIPILTVHMRAKATGDAVITAGDASINASDGSGSNILDEVRAARLTVTRALIVPAKPVVPTTPAPAPVVQPVATTTATSTAQEPVPTSSGCTGIFADCDIHFPTIAEVTVTKQQQVGNQIHVSGTAPAGDTVHVLLRRDGVLYKELQAIIQQDRTWEAVFTNVYSYGKYSIEALAETTDGRASERAVWKDILIYPPFTAQFFGTAVRWPLLLVLLLAGLTFITLISAGYFYARHGRVPTRVIVTLGFLVLASIAMTVRALYLVREEYATPLTYWKNTTVPCISLSASLHATYKSALLQVYVDDQPQTIPADTGISPQCVARIHTHDDTGHLHFALVEPPLTLLDFFAVASLSLNRPGYRAAVTVNRADRTADIATYGIREGDLIVVRYTKLP